MEFNPLHLEDFESLSRHRVSAEIVACLRRREGLHGLIAFGHDANAASQQRHRGASFGRRAIQLQT
jgi:hypothetical protein